MAGTVVAIFCMPEHGHFMLLRALISGFVQAGCNVHVFTHRRYGPDVERMGARLVDLFTEHPIEHADSESVPVPCRYVSFAAYYAEEVLEKLRSIRPALVVCETFAVIGRLAAQRLGVPFINVLPGHNIHPQRFLPALHVDPRVAISQRCHRAVAILRERYGMHDASPFSYIAGHSPHLNVCCQPPEFLTEEERNSFEPVAFYGCIPSPDQSERPNDAAHTYFAGGPDRFRIYACFGTVALRYYADVATRVFEMLSNCLADMPKASALISLGGAAVEDGLIRRLRRPNVEVVEYTDQRAVLGEADVFLTHHGLNSTHEAIFQRVPMLSYPIFTDQPALAERCRQFGIAVPLASSVRGPVVADDVRAGLETLAKERESIMARLEQTRSWELDVMAQRPAVLTRMLELARANSADTR
ncbi:glycosyltransferase [Dongia deserti]|uniref:glycosyltransferase n=1 Tax=Dongia deserti TaxID=2268030 RepID=UPI0013C4E004|nr:glycosyltransferase [Dongia deserti]